MKAIAYRLQRGTRCLGTLLPWSLTIAALHAQTVPDKATIARVLTEARSRIESLRVVTRLPDEAPGLPRGHYLHAELSFRGSQKIALDFAHGADDLPWHTDYHRNRSMIAGRQYSVDWPVKIAHEQRELAEGELPQRFAIQPWHFASGYWPHPVQIPLPKILDVPSDVLTVLADERYVLRSQPESRRGVECHVVERGRFDRLFLDSNRGYALVARHVQDEQGRGEVEIDVDSMREVAEGLWLPVRFRTRTHNANATGQDAGATTILEVEVTEIELNKVSDSAFTLVHRPGELRIIRTLGQEYQQVQAGGLDYLVRLGDRVRSLYLSGQDTFWGDWALVALVSLSALLIAWYAPAVGAFRYRRRGTRKPDSSTAAMVSTAEVRS